MKQIIIIPSYNSNAKLDELIEKIRGTSILMDILVVDDGSPVPVSIDKEGVSVIRNDKNMGKGAALLNGFSCALEKGYTHAVTMDSDLQHLPEEISLFVEYDEQIDFVLGCRERDPSMPVHRRFSNFITSLLISSICKRNIHDSQCGFRRYRLESIKNKIYKESGFQFESEILIRCIYRSSNIKQVQISTVYNDDNKSYINNVSDTWKFIKLLLRSVVL